VSRALRGGLALAAIAALLVATASCGRKRIVHGEGASTIEATSGEDIVIELAADPTTGYSWTPTVGADPTIAVQMGSDYAGGHQRFTFRAVGRGKTTLRFDYRRAWESAPQVKSATFTITVR
jgi:inhibitor of cysteine peptidase